MLTDGENKCVIDCQARTLGLHDVKIVALGMRGRMAKDKVVGRILSAVHYRKSQSHRVWNVSAGVHKALLAGVEL